MNTGRAVGACFLLAFVVFSGGWTLVDSASGVPADLARAADHQTLIAAGVLLMLANSVLIAAVGVLMFPVLRRTHEVSAHGYLICRSVEAMMCAVGTIFLLLLVPLADEYSAGGDATSGLPAIARVAQQANHYSYEVGMAAVGIGGVVLCRVLLRAHLVPRFLAVWGLAGYGVFFVGSVLEVLGYGVGTVLSVPGGLFEVALGVRLITRGFSTTDDAQDTPVPIPPSRILALALR